MKHIIESSISGNTDKIEVDKITDQIENSLKAYKDNQENRILYYGTSVAVIALSVLLIYTTKSSWPVMFLVIWFGLFMYYRVHEKSLVLNNLDKISKVDNADPLTKIVFLKSAIDLKVGRKSVLKIFLSVLISSAAMMVHFLFVDSSFWMNIVLLVGAITASYFFWQYFYKEEIVELESMKEKLHRLESQLILGGAVISEEEE